MGKKVTSFLLAFVMIIGMMPALVYADPVIESTDESQVVTESTLDSVAEEPADESEAAQTDGEDEAQPEASDNGEVEGNVVEVSNGQLIEAAGTDATYEIKANGTYNISKGLSGAFVISEGVTDVTFVGQGVEYNTDTTDVSDTGYGYITSTPNSITIDASAAQGVHITLKNLYNSVTTNTANLLNFSGENNRLTIKGTVLLDYNVGYTSANDALIHVNKDTALTIDGDGTCFQYNCTQGAGIGGNTGEANGTINFNMTGSYFIKGTRQGAVIGAGARSSVQEPGPISFNSGYTYVVTNSRGAAIGGSAGSSGASAGTNVYVNGGTLSVNTDYSGAGIGGGGYDSGNDSSGGTLIYNGGSVRPYADTNAINSGGWKGEKVTEAGVADLIITAQRVNGDGENVYFATISTEGISADSNGNYNLYVDDATKPIYSGPLHQHHFAYDGVDRDITWETYPVSTIANWYPMEDNNIYVFLTGENHTVTVNGVKQNLVWNEETGTFEAASAPELTADDECILGEDATITFADDETWRGAVTKVTVNDTEVEGYTLEAGKLVIPAAAFAAKGDYTIAVQADGYKGATVTQTVLTNGKVEFKVTPSDADITVSAGTVFNYTEATFEGIKREATETEPAVTDFYLDAGNYTAVIKKDGYYASEFTFQVKADGTFTSDSAAVRNYIKDGGIIEITLPEFAASANEGAWDGKTLDVSWYSESADTMYVSTPAQFAGIAAIDNGIFNYEITTIIDDANGDGEAESYAVEDYMKLENAKIRPANSSGDTTGPNGNNLVTSSTYWYGVKSDGTTHSDFADQTIYVTADLDMGGYQKEDGSWTGARMMSIGGQSLMHYIDYATWISDGYSHLGSSFNGHLEGNGHVIYNMYLDRYAAGPSYGDSQSAGLIGRLGNHDSDSADISQKDPSVRNIAVHGYVSARRSVGAIVGKIGQTSASRKWDGSTGGIVENCVNFATVLGTDAKGQGGIVGAGWNKGKIENCVNFGNVTTKYNKTGGGISGSDEVPVTNCYNVGYVDGSVSAAQALGTNNGGAKWTNCYWLSGSSAGCGYSTTDEKTRLKYSAIWSYTSADTFYEVTSYADLKSDDFLAKINGTSRAWAKASESDSIYKFLKAQTFKNLTLDTTDVTAENMPIPRVFTTDSASCAFVGLSSAPTKLEYIEGQTFDATGMVVTATWSDGTTEDLTDYTISKTDALETTDKVITVSGERAGCEYSFDIDITVAQNELTAFEISSKPNCLVYASDETFNPTGLMVRANYTNFPNKWVTLEDTDYTWELQDNKLVVSYTYNDVTMTDSCDITFLDTPAPKANEEGAYEIGSTNDMLWFQAQVTGARNTTINGVVTADFEMGSDFCGVGTSSYPYEGTFDGQGHTITINIESSYNAAGLFAYAGAATIENVNTKGTITTTAGYLGTGGIVGQTSKKGLVVENCVSNVDINGAKYLGGILGKGYGETIKNCKNYGNISGTGQYVAGILGSAAAGDVIDGCVNYGNVTNTSNYAVGGILSQTYYSTSVTITNCGNEGAITGQDKAGGILGYAMLNSDTISTSYNAGTITATNITASGGAGGVVGYSNATLTNVYNYGKVTDEATTSTGDAGIGGIVGYYTAGNISNAYNAGAVVPDGAKNSKDEVIVKAGAMFGYAASNSIREIKNSYMLDSLDIPSNGKLGATTVKVTGEAEAKTSKELKALAKTLGDAYGKNKNSEYHGGYPILTWEPGAEKEADITDGGIYTIKTALDTTKSLDIAAGSTAAGANLQIYSSNGSNAQKFIINKNDDNTYTIYVYGSGMALDVKGAGKTNGTNVWQYTANDSVAQNWYIVANDDGTYSFKSAISGLYLDVASASTKNGTNVWTYASNGSNAQKFVLECVDEVKVNRGWYYVAYHANNDYVLDVAAGATAAGANIQLYKRNNSKAQQFKVMYGTAGSIMLRTFCGKAVDVYGGQSAPFTNVWQHNANTSNAQKWKLVTNADGSYTLLALCSGNALDIRGGAIKNGTNVDTYPSNGSAAQKWDFIPVG